MDGLSSTPSLNMVDGHKHLIFFAITGLILFIYSRVKRHDPLGKIPGPLISRVSHIWLAYHARKGRRYIAVDKLHKKYGNIVRISPGHISIADFREIGIVYGQGARALDKSKFYDAFVGEATSVFSTTDRYEHSSKRKLLSRAFSYDSLKKYIPLIEKSLQQFVQELDKVCVSGQLLNLYEWLNFLTFDVLSDLAFGEAIGMVKNHSDIVEVQRPNGKIEIERAISLVDQREHMSVVIGIWPILGQFAAWLPDPLFRNGRHSSAGLADFARRCVTKRLEAQSHRDDLLTRLIDARGEIADENTAGSIIELTAETVTLLIAGSDTISSSVTATLFLTLTHQAVYSKVVASLESEVGDGPMSYDAVNDVPYLDAVIYEGLRYHATTAIGLHRVVPRGGIVCCGYVIPEGTEVSVPAFTIQRDPEIWGDPDNFRPERWMESENLKPYLLTFGRGPRACLGRNLAFIEMRLILATILLRYNIALKDNFMKTAEGFMHKPQALMAAVTLKKPS